MPNEYNILLLGEKGIGKTTYLRTLVDYELDDQYVPTCMHESFYIEVKRNGIEYDIYVHDTIENLEYVKNPDAAIIMVKDETNTETINLYLERIESYYKKTIPYRVIMPTIQDSKSPILELLEEMGYRCKPIRMDFQQIRKQRQRETNARIIQHILKSNYTELIPYINEMELVRVLEETGLERDALFQECKKNDILITVLSGRIAKNSTRQGSKDEHVQLDVCNRFANQFGVNIENLSAFAFRPTKDGRIVSAAEIKSQKIKKDECLKSFDGRITGRLEGWIFAKVVFGSGGHQDNVFEEADTLCEWVRKYGESTSAFVVLIDTDLCTKFSVLKIKYKDVANLHIVNHIEFQEYISNYGFEFSSK